MSIEAAGRHNTGAGQQIHDLARLRHAGQLLNGAPGERGGALQRPSYLAEGRDGEACRCRREPRSRSNR
jgi:hypothetical protein